MLRGIVSRRCYATGSHVAKKAEGTVSKQTSPHSEVKLTQMPNHMMVSSIQSIDARSSALTIGIKAGSRYESPLQQGMAHRVALLAGLGTAKDNQFGVSLRLTSIGGVLSSKHNRDMLMVSISTSQEHRDEALALLGEMTCEPGLHMYQLSPSAEQMLLQTQKKMVEPFYILDDLLHKAAYRGRGLGSPLYCNPMNATIHDRDMISDYLGERFITGNSALTAVNVEHDNLLEYSSELMPLIEGPGVATRGDINNSPYEGGEEHQSNSSNISHFIIAGPGASWQDLKGRATNTVLLSMIAGYTAVPWYSNGHGSLARKTIASKLGRDKGFGIVPYSQTYSDCGLVGLRISAPLEEIRTVGLAALEPLKNISTGSVKDEDLDGARNRSLVAALIESEDAMALVETTVSQCLSGPNFATPTDFAEAIGQVTKADITAAAKKLLSANPALATYGNPYTAPYLDNIWKV